MDTKKLRQKILDLAIHGKLVPQDSNDEPASLLLERIRVEKERLVKEGKIKKSKSSKTSDTPHYENVPFEVPEGWCWCKLDDLAFYKKGPFGSSLTKSMFVPDSPSAYKVYEQKNAINKDATLGHYFIDKIKFEELKGFAVQPEDIIVSCAGTIGETYVLPQNIREGIINQALMTIRLFDKSISDFYLLYFDFILKNEAANESKGTAIKNIPPFDILKNFFFPLPPLEEQNRIIEKVSYWLSFVNAIDSEGKEMGNLISKTKSKILDLAIHGKLVPQDPTDEPALELLKRISANAEITCDNEQYGKISKGWCLCRLGDIGKIVTGNTPTKDIAEYYGGNIPFYKPADLEEGKCIKNASDHLSVLGFEQARKIPANSILVTCIGATIGKTGLITVEGSCNQQINAIIPNEVAYAEFIYYTCISDYMQKEIKSNASATTLPILNKGNFAKLPFPLPPYNEQQRIVNKIEELFTSLDNIQKALEV